MGENVLVLGSGGREHALCWKIAESDLVSKVYCAPGNYGTGQDAVNVSLDPIDFSSVERFVFENDVRLTVVGPEAPLVAGIVDYFHESGLTGKGHLIVGPSKRAAMLEGSKAFAKEVMDCADVYTAPCNVVSTRENAVEFCRYILEEEGSVVIKADGLASGKGVFLCDSLDDVIEAVDSPVLVKSLKDGALVIEHRLHGPEFSYIVLCGGGYVPLASARDHKRAFDGDKGPNTGGMGAVSPTRVLGISPVLRTDLEAEVRKEIVERVLGYMQEESIPFSGFLYIGGMMEGDIPNVLEFNVRMGDPETQPIIMRMKSDIVPYLLASAEGTIGSMPKMEFHEESACCVVMASDGYPGEYDSGHVISGLDVASALDGVRVFHAGTAGKDGRVVTAGGRVLGVTALGDNLDSARKRAYRACAMVHWKGSFYRRDIGQCEFDDYIG